MSISSLNLSSIMSKRLVAVLIMCLVVVVAMAAAPAAAAAANTEDDQQVVVSKSLVYLYELMIFSSQRGEACLEKGR